MSELLTVSALTSTEGSAISLDDEKTEHEPVVAGGLDSSSTVDDAEKCSLEQLCMAVHVLEAREFSCTLCNKRFRWRSNLRKHVRSVHDRVRPFDCEMCGMSFGQKSSIDKHILVVHEKRRPHSCEQCGASFGQIGDLNVHTRTVHEKRRPFACRRCNAAFGLRSQLNKHLRVVHQKLRPYVCLQCSAAFGERSDLRKHTQSQHCDNYSAVGSASNTSSDVFGSTSGSATTCKDEQATLTADSTCTL